MKSQYSVYALVDGTEVRYVGYSAFLTQRQKRHASKHPDWRLIVLGIYPTRESGLEHEKWRIRRFHGVGHNLTNITEGGQPGTFGSFHSYLTKSKISAAHRGKLLSDETKAKISAFHKGKRHSAETRVKMSIAHKGKLHSAESKIKISVVNKKRFELPEERTKLSVAHKGMSLSAKHRSAISVGRKRLFESPKERSKMSIARKRRPWSTAHRAAQERSEENNV